MVYRFDVGPQAWTIVPPAVYDGGWGDGLEFVGASDRLYQVDGRNVGNTTQGTAMLTAGTGDVDESGMVDGGDLGVLLAAWGPCGGTCCPADLDENGVVDGADLGVMLSGWTGW